MIQVAILCRHPSHPSSFTILYHHYMRYYTSTAANLSTISMYNVIAVLLCEYLYSTVYTHHAIVQIARRTRHHWRSWKWKTAWRGYWMACIVQVILPHCSDTDHAIYHWRSCSIRLLTGHTYICAFQTWLWLVVSVLCLCVFTVVCIFPHNAPICSDEVQAAMTVDVCYMC